MRSEFKPVYIPISLTVILLIMAVGSSIGVCFDLLKASMGTSNLPVFLLLILPLCLALAVFAGLMYFGIIIGIWAFYGMCFLLAKFVKKYFIEKDSFDEDVSMDTKGEREEWEDFGEE